MHAHEILELQTDTVDCLLYETELRKADRAIGVNCNGPLYDHNVTAYTT